MTTIHTAKIWNTEYRLRADWTEASSQIYQQVDDGPWSATGYRVADSSHRPALAMRVMLAMVAKEHGRNYRAFAQIEDAIEHMTEEQA